MSFKTEYRHRSRLPVPFEGQVLAAAVAMMAEQVVVEPAADIRPPLEHPYFDLL